MNFTVVLNTRNRVTLLDNLLKSMANTIGDFSSLEIFICYDSDDISTINYLSSSVHYLPFTTVKCKRGDNLHGNLNKAVALGTGKYIFGLNDDCEIISKNWDIESFDRLESYLEGKKDGIVYGQTVDTSCDKGGDKAYSSFPVISRSAADTLGFFMPPKFTGWGADVWSYRLYASLNRVCPLPTIEIDHVGHNTLDKVFNPDQTQMHIRNISNNTVIDPYNCDITIEQKKLLWAINNEKK